MRVSYRWLLRALGMEAKDLPLAEVVERLTMAGIEVEAVLDLGAGSGRVIAARILERVPHPNADKLGLCQVDAGGPEPLKIVCGAPNADPGSLVPLAAIGASLPNGMTIERRKVRGEVSEGMMCSARELGWSEEAAGLLILPPEGEEGSLYRKGEPFDALLDIKITPNRPDCLSVRGLVRELRASILSNRSAAEAGTPLSAPQVALCQPPLDESGPAASELVQVRLDAPDACPRYLGRVIRGVKVGPSPLWLRRAVESAGIRSISNIVDVTNYILVESGQPLHAFDLARVAQSTVVIRRASEGEKVVTLDGQEATLTADDLLIADPEKPIALAGIMGCGNSEISDETTDVFLECAWFAPAVIRRTSKRLAKSTDSSYRFERGVDWQALPELVDRAAALIAHVGGGTVAPGVLTAGPGIEPQPPIALRVDRVSRLLGLPLSKEEVENALLALDFMIEPPFPSALSELPAGDDSVVLQVRVPAFRPDITREADLIEEIARVVGYNRIPEELPRLQLRPSAAPREERTASRVRASLAGSGFLETTSYSFLAAEALERLGYPAAPGSRAVRLKNPLSAEYAVMRPSLVPGLLETLLYNQNHGNPDVRLFEIGKTFLAAEGEASRAGGDLPVEEHIEFAALIAGSAGEPSWRAPARPADFYDMKGVAETLLADFGLREADVEFVRPDAEELAGACRVLHPGKSAVVRLAQGGKDAKKEKEGAGAKLFALGELHPAVRAELELKRTVYLLFGRVDALMPFLDRLPALREIPAFPPVTRDLALVADRTTPAAEIESVIARRAKSLLASLRLFDLYEGDRIPAGKRSLAYQLRFAAPDRTLTDDEVNQVIEKILGDLKAKLDVELRAS